MFAIPIPAINIALIDTNDKNCEKLLIILFNPLAEFSGYLSLTFSSSLNISSIPQTLNIFKGIILLYQYNKLNDFVNQINIKASSMLINKNTFRLKLQMLNLPYNIIHIINGMIKCLSLELFSLCNDFWGENFIDSISGAVEKNQDYVSVSSEIELLKKAEKNPKDENHENNLKSKIEETPKTISLD